MKVYYQNMSKKSTLFNARHKMVKMALVDKMTVTYVANYFGCSRKTVYKWIKRYKNEKLQGLKDRSRRPHNSPNKISKYWENRIIELRNRFPGFGPWRILQMFNIPFHENTIYKVFKRNGLIKKNKKFKRRNQEKVREWKRKLKPFEKIQVDVKYLDDIPNLYPKIIIDKFPAFLYSARDIKTGMVFFCYAYEKSLINSTIFISYLLGYLKELGVDIEKIKIQTDNGSEFVGHPESLKDSIFTKMINNTFNAKHILIPPASPTYNSDVETFHKAIQKEIFETEQFNNISEFIAKSYAYQIFYNYERKIQNRGIPVEILKNNFTKYRNFKSLFIPVILDSLLTKFLKYVKIKNDLSVTYLYKLSTASEFFN